jgi:hypothetical protein
MKLAGGGNSPGERTGDSRSIGPGRRLPDKAQVASLYWGAQESAHYLLQQAGNL